MTALAHDPGQRLEVDFGHIYADFPESRRQVPQRHPFREFAGPVLFNNDTDLNLVTVLRVQMDLAVGRGQGDGLLGRLFGGTGDRTPAEA